jgi:hypothetical protein
VVFIKRLEVAKRNLAEHKNGRIIYERFVKPSMIDLAKVAAHYAISSLFEEYGDPQKIYCYSIALQDYQKAECGKARLGVGRVRVTSEITRESQVISFGVLHLGEQNMNAGVSAFRGDVAYQKMVSGMIASCALGEISGLIREMDKYFDVSTYSLRSLFRDEQRKVLNKILGPTLTEIEAEHRKIYQANYPMMRFLSDLGDYIPTAFLSSASLILNSDLRVELAVNSPNIEVISKLFSEVKLWEGGFDVDLGYVFRQTLEKRMSEFAGKPESSALLDQTLALVNLARSTPFVVELRGVQNIYYRLFKTSHLEIQAKVKHSGRPAGDWVTQFLKLGEALSMRIA